MLSLTGLSVCVTALSILIAPQATMSDRERDGREGEREREREGGGEEEREREKQREIERRGEREERERGGGGGEGIRERCVGERGQERMKKEKQSTEVGS